MGLLALKTYLLARLAKRHKIFFLLQLGNRKGDFLFAKFNEKIFFHKNS